MSILLPADSSARVTILHVGYVGDRVGSTVGLVEDGASVVIIDPGMAASQALILEPLAAAGFGPHQVTDVVFSHHHPDHTINAGLFPEAWVHDHWARYRHDVWDARPADGYQVSPSVRLAATPGHTPQDISTVVSTKDGAIVFTHLWWHADGPPEDPLASDPAAIHRHRGRVLAIAGLIVPGHGAAFTPDGTTPR